MSTDNRPSGDDAEGSEGHLHQIRAARNQALFREVNERLQELNRDFSQAVPIGDLVCECANPACTDRIGMSLTEYETLRADPTLFAVRRGHDDPDLEDLLEERPGYTVIQKRGPAAAYVTRVDPRTRPDRDHTRRPRGRR